MIVTRRDTYPLLFEHGDEIDMFKLNFYLYILFYFINNVSNHVVTFLYSHLTFIYSLNFLFRFGAVPFCW